MIYAAFLVLMFLLGGESGASFPWSKKWQKGFGLDLGQLPEAITSLLLGFITMSVYQKLGLDSDFYIETGIFVLVTAIVYAGIQSANWMFLKWTKDAAPNTERDSDFKPIIDWLAEKFGWKLGDEGYSWIAATFKGTIITLPLGGLGGILFALGYEIGSHTRNRRMQAWFGDTHFIAEGLSFVGIGVYALIVLNLI